MAQEKSRLALDQVKAVFCDNFFGSEDGMHELLRCLKARNAQITDFEAALQCVEPQRIGGVGIGSAGYQITVSEVLRSVAPEDRNSLKSWYQERAREAREGFRKLRQEFPDQFD